MAIIFIKLALLQLSFVNSNKGQRVLPRYLLSSIYLKVLASLGKNLAVSERDYFLT